MSVVEAQALYEVLLTSGSSRFNQAVTTPFVTGPVADKLGPFTDNEYCAAILQGTIDFDDLAAITEVHDLIRGMRYPNPAHPTPPIDTTITTEDLSALVKNHCEHTSSSPSGHHFGHYHTLLCDPDILGYIASIVNFCFQWGKTLHRWEKVTYTLIPKEPGISKLTCIQCIPLIEVDLNHLCLSEIYGKRLMDNAEQYYDLLHASQYSSRKGKMAIRAVLLKRFSYDIIQQSRMDACMVDNDVAACYDQVIPSIAMIKS
jgi:hypothetical protein